MAPRPHAAAAAHRRGWRPRRGPLARATASVVLLVLAAVSATSSRPRRAWLQSTSRRWPGPGPARTPRVVITAEGVAPPASEPAAEAASPATPATGSPAEAPANPAHSGKKEEIHIRKKYINDSVRNVLLIGGMGGIVAASWLLTGKWWKMPLTFALPSMLYRLWITRMDTTKLAEVSASVDMKYVASSEKEQKELHSYMCGECGYTLFPARGREAAFFTDSFVCPMCKAPKEAFFDMKDDDDDEQEEKDSSAAGVASVGSTAAPAPAGV